MPNPSLMLRCAVTKVEQLSVNGDTRVSLFCPSFTNIDDLLSFDLKNTDARLQEFAIGTVFNLNLTKV